MADESDERSQPHRRARGDRKEVTTRMPAALAARVADAAKTRGFSSVNDFIIRLCEEAVPEPGADTTPTGRPDHDIQRVFSALRMMEQVLLDLTATDPRLDNRQEVAA